MGEAIARTVSVCVIQHIGEGRQCYMEHNSLSAPQPLPRPANQRRRTTTSNRCVQAQFPCTKLKGETEHTKGGIGTLLSSVAETAVYLWTGTCLRLAPCRSGVAAWGLSGGGVEGMPLFFNFVPAPRHFTHNTDSHTSTPKKRGGQHYLSDRVSVRCIGSSCRSTRDANSRPIEPVSAPSHRPRCWLTSKRMILAKIINY